MNFDFEPPVVTDDWWLDVVEYSGSNDMEGTFQEAMGWGRWGFPLPTKVKTSIERGERLARAALQMLWQEKAEMPEYRRLHRRVRFSNLFLCSLDYPQLVMNIFPIWRHMLLN